MYFLYEGFIEADLALLMGNGLWRNHHFKSGCGDTFKHISSRSVQMTSMTCREQTVLPFCEDDDFGCIYTAGLEAQFQFVDYIHFF